MLSKKLSSFSSVPCLALQLTFMYAFDNSWSSSIVNDIEPLLYPFDATSIGAAWNVFFGGFFVFSMDWDLTFGRLSLHLLARLGLLIFFVFQFLIFCGTKIHGTITLLFQSLQLHACIGLIIQRITQGKWQDSLFIAKQLTHKDKSTTGSPCSYEVQIYLPIVSVMIGGDMKMGNMDAILQLWWMMKTCQFWWITALWDLVGTKNDWVLTLALQAQNADFWTGKMEKARQEWKKSVPPCCWHVPIGLNFRLWAQKRGLAHK